MKLLFQQKDLQMFSLKLNKYKQFSPATAIHNFKWVKI